ncbi:C-GCAxxG-C-C family protein [Christensenellaceae bacterium OttesenSCG-928-M15]|nr:C-GCAxxG-C-C family protein [Christensenellaceae bacterium OttesenSCG-928-M15]
MAKATQAVACFHNGFNCAQAILSTYCEALGLDKETALKLSCGLGAGMGRLGHVCGAVSGAYLLLGLKYGQAQSNDKEAKEKTYALVQEFSKKFKERNGTTICRDLLGVDLLLDDKVLAAERVKEVCPKIMQYAAEIIEELLF